MRKLIRSTSTKAFLTKESTWTNDVRQAEDFRDKEWQPVITQRLHLENVEFYYLFGSELNPQYDFVVPFASPAKDPSASSVRPFAPPSPPNT